MTSPRPFRFTGLAAFLLATILLAFLEVAASTRPLAAQTSSPPLAAGAHLASPVTLLGSEAGPVEVPATARYRPAADSSYNWSAGGIGALVGAAGAVALVALFAHDSTQEEPGPTVTYIGVGVLGGLFGFFTGLAIGNP